jgi:O-acetyl-ADP-ribose deacetylase (regulator of RNase III)
LLATRRDLRTIAFPSISTGAFYYPKTEAAQVASLAIKEFLSQDKKIAQVNLVFFSPKDAGIFIKHNCF